MVFGSNIFLSISTHLSPLSSVNFKSTNRNPKHQTLTSEDCNQTLAGVSDTLTF